MINRLITTLKYLLTATAIFILLSQISYATQLPKTKNVPGGVAIITLSPSIQPKPRVLLKHRRIMVLQYKHKWIAVVGIPLNTKPGKLNLTIKDKTNTKKIRITVRPINYRKDFVVLKNKRLVTPIKQDLRRIKRERKTINKKLATWSNKSNINMRLIWPTTGRISASFALRRYYNGISRSQHHGIDIAAPKNTPVKAAGAGKVILTGNYFYMGNVVFIDHGQGLITAYCHLNKIKVKPNQSITQGQAIGLVGSTGRSTGPHLHWSVRLNNTAVNPYLFVGKMKRKQKKKVNS